MNFPENAESFRGLQVKNANEGWLQVSEMQ